jgi:beta-lactamase class A
MVGHHAAVLSIAYVLLVGAAVEARAQESKHVAPDLRSLRANVERIARDANGRLAVGIELLETGQSVLVHGARHQPMQSVYKLPIAMAVLHEVDRGKLQLDQQVQVRPSDFVTPHQHSPLRDSHPEGARVSLRELLRLAVSGSDGTASDVLLDAIGGMSRAQAYLERIDVHEVRIASTEKQIGRDDRAQYRSWATARGALSVLRAVYGHDALSDSSRALLMRWLTETTISPGRLRGLLPVGTIVAHKTGSSGTVQGLTAATNDIGIVTLPDGRHLAIAVLLGDSRVADAARDSVIARVARSAWDAWTAPRAASAVHSPPPRS